MESLGKLKAYSKLISLEEDYAERMMGRQVQQLPNTYLSIKPPLKPVHTSCPSCGLANLAPKSCFHMWDTMTAVRMNFHRVLLLERGEQSQLHFTLSSFCLLSLGSLVLNLLNFFLDLYSQ